MISMNWVKDYVDLTGEDLEELAVKVTRGGLNVEDVKSLNIKNLVIGEIIECEDHPDSDHLHVCKVNTGDTTRQIVCGASNVRKGIKVIVALPGAVLPGDFEIKTGKIRGVESDGMICAKFELGLEEKTEETYAAGITELGDDAKVGEDPIEYLGLDDTIYDLDNHKRRNNDVYYHIGFAYEVATVLNKTVKLPEANYSEIKDKIEDNFTLKVETDKCPFYAAKMVKNVTIGDSPDFIKKRLTNAGMRPINNVVDISNYVMLEYGQPMHFFDYDKLGKNILVRDAKDNEEIITLDGKSRVLNNKDIVITDGSKAVCIAGVMGGENTEVDESTKTILIESAIFDSVSIRNTAQKLDLKSEASIRYGKGLNFEYTIDAINRACYLLEKYAGGEVLSGMILHDKIDKSLKTVDFVTEQINKILGIVLTDDDVKAELRRLHFEYTYLDGKFSVTIPRRRIDIDPNVQDIAEEIGRFYGYENLVSTLPRVPIRKGEYAPDVKIRKDISKRLRSLGLNQCLTYTLTSPEMASMFKYDGMENIILPNPMSTDKSVIRTSLLPSLLNTYEYNKARKVNDILIYEIAKTYNVNYEETQKVAILMKGNYVTNSWNQSSVKVDFYLLKGIVENVLDYLGFKNRYSFEVDKNISELHPGVSARILLDRKEIGIIGKLHPSIKKDEIYVCEIAINPLMTSTKAIKYKEANKYPEMVKDVAFIIDNEITSKEIEEVIKKSGGRLLSNIEVFDLYNNIEEGKKSMAYKLTFVDSTRTLTDDEVMEVFNKIIDDVTSKMNAKLRNN
ncbi:MAG: phenylalanine--tRNA ligase subunit beta [Erysipelotrichales bacterium]|nr:phenylalanine--tRNA ligase subunit beta [Erysipelotrichales bacterium]